MSEKPHNPESGKEKHKGFLSGARFELGSLSIGGIAGALGMKLVSLLGVMNPYYLLGVWAVSAIGGWIAARKA